MRTSAISTLLIYLLLQSCAAYKKTAVRLDQAVNKGKVLVVLENGQEKNFDNIVFKDSTYYGVKAKSKGESQQEQISAETSQTFLSKASKNIIHATLTGYMMSGSAFAINYDRKIGKSLWLSTGFGGYPFLEEDGKKIDVKFMYLTGKRDSHLEVCFGITYGFSEAREAQVTQYAGTIPAIPAYQEIYPAFTLGYRYQKPGPGPIFRFGFGYLESYAGIGFQF